MPLFEFQRFDPRHAFQPLAVERVFDQLSEALLEHGEWLLRQLQRLPEEDRWLVEQLIREGYLSEEERGRLVVTVKGLRRIAQKALHDLFIIQRRDASGRHETGWRGTGEVTPEETRPYQFGDPLSLVAVHETLKNALHRQAEQFRQFGPQPHLRLQEEDFVVQETLQTSRCATVVLLDMSGSMGRFGKFLQAKRVALALRELVRQRYPEDFLEFIGFYTFTTPLPERALLLAAPKEVSIFDSRVYLRFSLENPPPRVPEHFTNLQAGPASCPRTITPTALREQADFVHHRRRTHCPYRRHRGGAAVSALGENCSPDHSGGCSMSPRGDSDQHGGVGGRSILFRPDAVRTAAGSGVPRAGCVLFRG
jgi:Ca-activated chloride channel family protein